MMGVLRRRGLGTEVHPHRDAASTSQDRQSPRSQERGLEHLPYSEPALLTPGPWTSSLQDRETLTPTVKVTTW